MRLERAGLFNRRARRWEGSFNAGDPLVLELEARRQEDERRERRLALTLALTFHLALMVLVVPAFESEPRQSTARQVRVYRLEPVKLKPPDTRPRPRQKSRAARTIPIPDPTPFDPEPVLEDEDFEVEEVDLESLVDVTALPVPDAPPGPASRALRITGDIEAPVKLQAPAPAYPEEARRARVRGVVILETIIDTVGHVTDVRVLKGLPSGLTEAAIAAVSGWTFRPARLDGQPVAVYYLVTVTFDLQ